MPASRRLFLQASLSALLAPRAIRADSPPLVCRPYVQDVRKTQASVRWTTLEPGTPGIRLVAPDGSARSVTASTTVVSAAQTGLATRFQHEARVTGLSPATDYSYQILLDERSVSPDVLSFRTMGTLAFQFLAVGDTGTGSEEQAKLARLMQEERPRLVIHTGDVAYPSGHYETYERNYFDYYHAIMRRVPFYPTPGNHDYYDTGAQPYFSVHGFPSEGVPAAEHGRYYTFEWADAQFFSLDSNDTLEAAAKGKSGMLDWLARELEASRRFWRVVFFHHPPYASGAHNGDPLSALVRQHIVPILERYAVPLVFNGHEHSYQRSHPIRDGAVNPDGVTYCVTGGGGAPLFEVLPSPLTAAGVSAHHYMRAEVDGRTLTARAIGLAGRDLDSFTMKPPPVLAPKPVVNSASFTPLLGRGSLISLLGWQMSAETRDNAGRPLAAGDSDVRVLLAGLPLPLLMVSPTQINAVLPGHVTGAATIEVITPAGRATAEVEILPTAPALFPGTFLDASGTPITADSVCRGGDRIQVFATGLTGYDGALTVRIGNQTTSGQVSAAELHGLEAVWFAVPAGLARGFYSVTVEVSGVRSNAVILPVG